MKRPKDYTDQLVRDVWHVVNFCLERRRRDPDVVEACCAVAHGPDEDALRFLFKVIEHRGAYGRAEWRAIFRLRRALERNDEGPAMYERFFEWQTRQPGDHQ